MASGRATGRCRRGADHRGDGSARSVLARGRTADAGAEIILRRTSLIETIRLRNGGRRSGTCTAAAERELRGAGLRRSAELAIPALGGRPDVPARVCGPGRVGDHGATARGSRRPAACRTARCSTAAIRTRRRTGSGFDDGPAERPPRAAMTRCCSRRRASGGVRRSGACSGGRAEAGTAPPLGLGVLPGVARMRIAETGGGCGRRYCRGGAGGPGVRGECGRGVVPVAGTGWRIRWCRIAPRGLGRAILALTKRKSALILAARQGPGPRGGCSSIG